MNKAFYAIVAAVALSGCVFLSGRAGADELVNGYYRQNGTYVQPYYRTSPDSTPFNNYSTQGNVNPYTGQPGTHNPYSNSYGNGLGTGLNPYGR